MVVGGTIADIAAGRFVNIIVGGTITNSYAGLFETESGGTVTNRYGIWVTLNHAAAIGHVIKLAATPTGDAFQIRSSADAVLAKFTAGGLLQVANGTAGAPSLSFASQTNLGFFRRASDEIGISSSGGSTAPIIIYTPNGNNGQIKMGSGFSIGWTSVSQDANAGADTVLLRDAANTLAQRNGTSAQTLRLYGTYTDASNYERLGIRFAAGDQYYISVEAAGTGSSRNLNVGTEGAGSVRLRANGTSRWEVNSSGHFLAMADNTYDIGASGANRPRDLYLGRDAFHSGKITVGGVATINQVTKILQGSAVIDPASVNAQTLAALGTVTVTGAAAGDTVFIGLPASWANSNMVIKWSVTAANTITIYGYNPNTVTAIDLASETIKVYVHQQ